MSENTPAPDIRVPRRIRLRRRALFAVGSGLGILVAAVAAAGMVSALALADQPGRVLEVPAVIVDQGTGPAVEAPVGAPAPGGGTDPADLPATPGGGSDSDSSPGSGSGSSPGSGSGSGSSSRSGSSPGSSPGAQAEPELVPAPAPIVVDAQGGEASKDDAGHDRGTSGSDGTSDSSGSGASGGKD